MSQRSQLQSHSQSSLRSSQFLPAPPESPTRPTSSSAASERREAVAASRSSPNQTSSLDLSPPLPAPSPSTLNKVRRRGESNSSISKLNGSVNSSSIYGKESGDSKSSAQKLQAGIGIGIGINGSINGSGSLHKTMTNRSLNHGEKATCRISRSSVMQMLKLIAISLLGLTCVRLLWGATMIMDCNDNVHITAEHARNSSESDTNEFEGNPVLTMDEAVLSNVEATKRSAHTTIEWHPSSMGKVRLRDNLNDFQPVALMATVDRRPLTARRQMNDDAANLNSDGSLLGCAFSTSTFVSKIPKIEVELKGMERSPALCDLCIQFTNVEDMNAFLPKVGYQPLLPSQTSIATKCIGGKAQYSARFAKWQRGDERYTGFGYPFNVDCRLPNGIKELTCREISNFVDDPKYRDSIQNLYLRTKFTLKGDFGDAPFNSQPFNVITTWPWDAIRSHDDDRRPIAKGLSKSATDSSSAFVPDSPSQLRLMHVEGPGYDRAQIPGEDNLEHGGNIVLASTILNPDSPGGVHFRLISNLIHFIRNAPESTHLVAVVHGQARHTFHYLAKLLNTKISELFPQYADSIYKNYKLLKTKQHISLQQMLVPDKQVKKNLKDNTKYSSLTLQHVLEMRGIQIKVVPIFTPSIAFEKLVCGGQYAFTSYLAARYAADYDVIMYIDGDTAILEKDTNTLQDIMYNRFFGPQSKGCVGHRFALIEQFVQPENEEHDRVLQCTNDLLTNATKWEYANKNCVMKEGHIAARTDSIYEFNVHHPDTLPDYTTPGVKDCITPGNRETQEYFFGRDEVVQLHLRNRERKPECACFLNE